MYVRFSDMLSVIVPVYNTAPFLSGCLDSLLGQTYRNLEIICVNDGSTDASAAILDAYAAKDSRIKVIHQENAGVSAARNRGIDVAKGDLITFVDGDDWLEPDAYAKVVAAMVDGVDLVCFGMSIDGEILPENRCALEAYYQVKRQGLAVACKSIVDTDGSVSNKVFKLDIVRKKKLRFDTQIACGEDAAFYFSYAAVVGNAYYLPEGLYHYEQHGESAMARFRERTARGLDHLRVLESVFCFYEKNGVMQKMQSVYDWLFSLYYDQALVTTPEEMYPEVHRMAYALAVKSGSIQANHLPQIRRLKGLRMSPVEKRFHWYADNRECFGFRGRAICSITYETDKIVYRVFGKRVKTVCMPEHA